MDEFWDDDDDFFFDETGLLEKDDCVLVVVDIQDKLLAVMDDKDAILENAIKLVKFANIVGLPVLVTEQEKLGPTVQALADEVRDFDPIMKLDFDASCVAGFLTALTDLDRDTVVLVGIESHICVTQTALSLLPLVDVHVVADAVTSRTQQNKKIALDRMRLSGATITSTEIFMYEILKTAGTDEFKETLKLVK